MVHQYYIIIWVYWVLGHPTSSTHRKNIGNPWLPQLPPEIQSSTVDFLYLEGSGGYLPGIL